MSTPFTFGSQRGGRNGVDAPLDLQPNQCQEAVNVDWFDTPFGRKRPGASLVSVEGDTAFTSPLAFLGSYAPAGEDFENQLWAIDSVGLVKRFFSGAWEDVALDDPITSSFFQISAVTFNGKYFIAYESGVNRLHVYDPALDRVRRVGLAAPAVPTIANQGVGAYAAVLRYYRTRVIGVSSGVLVARSEPSPQASFTPSGAGLAARITQGAPPSEHESHWEIEVSLDGLVWFVLRGFAYGNQIAIGTTFYDDTMVTTAYLDLDTAPDTGEYSLIPAVKMLATDTNRLIMAGRFYDGLPTSWVYRTPILGSTDEGDDERLQLTDTVKGYDILNENDNDLITALSPSVDYAIYAFKTFQTWKGTPTGDFRKPYQWRQISTVIGCGRHPTVIPAEDGEGHPIVAFLSMSGPYRVGYGGLMRIGRDIDDYWWGLNGKTGMSLDGGLTAHGVYHSEIHQIWWWVAQIGSSDESLGIGVPNIKIVCDVRQNVMTDQYGKRGGWSVHDGLSARATCSTMYCFPFNMPLSLRYKPYVGIGPEPV